MLKLRGSDLGVRHVRALPHLGVGAQVDSTAAGIHNDDALSVLIASKYKDARFRMDTDLHTIHNKTSAQTEVKTGLALSHEANAALPLVTIRHETSLHGSLPHERLLLPLPAIRVREDEVDIVCDRGPERRPGGLNLLDVRARAVEEVRKEVGEDVDDGLVGWQGR